VLNRYCYRDGCIEKLFTYEEGSKTNYIISLHDLSPQNRQAFLSDDSRGADPVSASMQPLNDLQHLGARHVTRASEN
jgi:hypothetical protein